MQELPASFHALANYNQFIVWLAVKDGEKIIKKPINPSSCLPHDPLDPCIWYDVGSAMSIAANLGEGFGVGFVFTKNDPFWFLDLDKCLDDVGQWSQQAMAFCQMFNGCAVEISTSGKGLHIIGTGAAAAGEHRKKNKDHSIEFYTADRFVALTGHGAMGDAGFDASTLIPGLVSAYFQPQEVNAANWTTEPDPNSRPLKTDKALIKKMCESGSAGAVFGEKATARDLWERNVEKLAIAYPSLNEKDEFDLSSADLGLCNHLAFWTGKDCERMERLFNMSSLVRDKWEKREQYRKDTILKACSAQTDVYGSQKAAKENARQEWNPDQSIVINSSVTANGGARVVAYEQRPDFFRGHCFLTKTSKVFCPDGVVRGQTEYNAMYSTAEFAEPFGGSPVKEAWKAYVTAPDMSRVEVFDTAYRPEYDFGVIFENCGKRFVNEYVNQDGVRVQGDAAPFINHVNLMLPNGRDAEILLSWMAAFVQYPGKKLLWSPFIQGVEGNGKSLIARILTYCIGEDHVEDVDPEDFCNSGGKFNKYITNHRLAVLEEIKMGRRNQAEGALKRFIGNGRIQTQGKGADQVTIRTCINWLLNSNYKDAIHITDHTRRFAILFCAQQEIIDLERHDMQRGGSYFRKLFDWLDNQNGWGIIANFLDTYVIPDEFNPAAGADKAPMTTSFQEAINESKSNPHQAVAEILTSDLPGTRKGWASVQAINKILRDDYGMKPPSGKMMAKYLKSEGYEKHQALTNQGRATKAIAPEGGRSVLYVKASSIQADIKEGSQATDHYLKAQGYTGLSSTINSGVKYSEN